MLSVFRISGTRHSRRLFSITRTGWLVQSQFFQISTNCLGHGSLRFLPLPQDWLDGCFPNLRLYAMFMASSLISFQQRLLQRVKICTGEEQEKRWFQIFAFKFPHLTVPLILLVWRRSSWWVLFWRRPSWMVLLLAESQLDGAPFAESRLLGALYAEAQFFERLWLSKWFS